MLKAMLRVGEQQRIGIVDVRRCASVSIGAAVVVVLFQILVHEVGHAWVQVVLLLLETSLIGEYIVSLRLLPNVIKLNTFADRARFYL